MGRPPSRARHIQCPECGGWVERFVDACPGCGHMFPGLTLPLLGCLAAVGLVVILVVIYTLSWLVDERDYPFLVAGVLAGCCLAIYVLSKLVRRM